MNEIRYGRKRNDIKKQLQNKLSETLDGFTSDKNNIQTTSTMMSKGLVMQN